MSAGAAILASDIPAFRKVLDDGQAGALFETGNATSLARRAAELLDDPARRAKLSEEARDAVRKYDWSTVARDVLRVYETVASTAGVEEDADGTDGTDGAGGAGGAGGTVASTTATEGDETL